MLSRIVAIMALAFTLAAITGPAFAFQCPYDMAKIDAALSKKPQLSAADLAKVKRLRAEGERLHKSSRTREAHAAAVEKFAQAKRVLGIQ